MSDTVKSSLSSQRFGVRAGHLLVAAVQAAAKAVNRVKAEAAANNALGNSRLAFPIVDAVEAQGATLIDDLGELFDRVAKGDRPTAKAAAVATMESFCRQTSEFGTANPIVVGVSSRNVILEKRYAELRTSLLIRLDHRFEDAAAPAGFPIKKLWEGAATEIGKRAVMLFVALLLLLVLAVPSARALLNALRGQPG